MLGIFHWRGGELFHLRELGGEAFGAGERRGGGGGEKGDCIHVRVHQALTVSSSLRCRMCLSMPQYWKRLRKRNTQMHVAHKIL